jgi:coenzyme F420-0:L-glutamate ligase/coenzyme F420-1:gamma-L-glutamate ligase
VSSHPIEIRGLTSLPEIREGEDLPAIILEACREVSFAPEEGDIFVVTQKIVSKAEGQIVDLRDVTPSSLAEDFANSANKDPRVVEVALREASRIVRMDQGILITETRHGFVCANSGVDASNVESRDTVTTLPQDPDASARRLREELEAKTGHQLAVILSDTFGRPWREGVTNIAIGVSGMRALVDYRGSVDPQGRSLATTVVAVADELASAAELVMGKLDHTPVAVIRGYPFQPGDDGAKPLLRARERDLFR